MVEVKKLYNVLVSPMITEKATRIASYNKYVFWVDKRSSKVQVRRAIEDIYKVKVTSVNVLSVKGRTKRLRFGQEGKTPSWKKAIVTLRAGDQIKLT
jgi:large subunit ribosomal protein L23